VRSPALVFAVFCAACGCAIACGAGPPASPFVGDDAGGGTDGADAGADAGDEEATADVAGDADPNLGGPCLDDGQCDDEIDCTEDECDEAIERCRYLPDPSRCDDGVYCNGPESCVSKLGCRAGEPVSCSDENTCTIDECVESDKSCSHAPRDTDGDGDPDWNCTGGDCNDVDPTVSSLLDEVCANGKDDDCDAEKDEADCSPPAHDGCVDALEITADGSFALTTVAATLDYSASCVATTAAWRDVVAAVVIPAGPALDVDLIATTVTGMAGLAAAEQCGVAASELGCSGSVPLPTGGSVARIRLRSLAPGAYPVYVLTESPVPLTLKARFLPASTAPANETCGTAAPIAPGVHETVEIVGVAEDHASECATPLGELVHAISLATPADVHAYASSSDGLGNPALSLLADPCAPTDEQTCRTGATPDLYARALAAGTHYLAVSASGPSTLDVVVETSPPTAAPADETCATAPPIAPGERVDVELAAHTDDAKLGCLPGAPDAAYALDLAAESDVMLIARLSDYDTGAASLAAAPCASPADLLACHTATLSPVRTVRHAVPAGSWRAVVESNLSAPMTLTPLVRAATAPVLVAFADTCASAIPVPETGGFFQGNTANATADYDTGCDLGGQPAGGAPDQMLRLTLAEQRRVVLDMQGSAYSTLLDVRKGPGCPGSEIVQACAAGYGIDRSYLDLVLDPGEYFVQIDGYAGDAGAWQLEVFVAEP
jgi:hypothetical protein